MTQDDALLREFLLEVKENLDTLDQSLVALERTSGDRSLLDSIFRSLHSTKGAAGFFGFTQLESLAHTGEALLNAVREGAVPVDAHTTGALLDALDALRAIARDVEATGAEQAHDYAPLLARMDALMQVPTEGTRVERQAPSAERGTRTEDEGRGVAAPAPAPVPAPRAQGPAPSAQGPAPVHGSPAHEPPVTPAGEMETIRVDVRVLDELMDLVGELVLSRNQILQVTTSDAARASGGSARDIAQSTQQLDRITTELQERVMKTRMQPIKQVWSKFPRVVRDLSHQLGKRVHLHMEGEETELDRTLIEAIKDPLTHLVRNGVDHGIETPDARVAAGKDPEGRFTLRAFHESGQVIIDVEDDGAGIAVDRIKRKAIERGIVTEEKANAMSAKEAMRLIFHAGLSTAEKVTTISGRGVGMDVVRSNIERIGGTIEVDSKQGAGTQFRIKIPLTLAIIPALLVNSEGGSRFAIPQLSVLELIRLKGEDIGRAIELVHGTRATRLRGQILPLLDLRELLGHSPRPSDRAVNIVVLQASKRKFGLLVDGVEESQEIVVKPLSRQLQDISIFAGATILGDGSIALILDTTGIANHGHLAGDAAEASSLDQLDQGASPERLESYLLVTSAQDGRVAIPLASVDRLEKFPLTRIERAGGAEVVQYRDAILRVLRLDDVLSGGYGGGSLARDRAAGDVMEVVVLHRDGSLVGLVVDRILDIVEMPTLKLQAATRAGVVGTLVIRERVTEVVDVARLPLEVGSVG